MSDAPVIYTVDERVATITLHRPEKLNAWTTAMDGAFRAAVREAGEDPEKIEEDMGDLGEDEEPFILPGSGKGRGAARGRDARGAPLRDRTLYDLQA